MTEPVADSFCLIAKPISWSAKDTDETILEIKKHNCVGKQLCGWPDKDVCKVQ